MGIRFVWRKSINLFMTDINKRNAVITVEERMKQDLIEFLRKKVYY